MAGKANTTAPEVEDALEAFDLAEWLEGATSPKDSITVYRDGEALRKLQQLLASKESMAQLSSDERHAQLSAITDDEAEVFDEKLEAEIQVQRELLNASGLTFEIEGLAPTETRLIQKKVEKAFKGRKDEDGNEYDDPTEHPDYGLALDDAYISRAVLRTTNPEGKTVKLKWTPEEVHMLRYNEATGKGLPANEFSRLSTKVVSVVYMRYDMDKMIDQDFS